MSDSGTVYREDLSDLFDQFWSDVSQLAERNAADLEAQVTSRVNKLVKDMRELETKGIFRWDDRPFDVRCQDITHA